MDQAGDTIQDGETGAGEEATDWEEAMAWVEAISVEDTLEDGEDKLADIKHN